MTELRIGFTGTRTGMTEAQKDSLMGVCDRFAFGENRIAEFHHGDCIGADDEFDLFMFEMMDHKNIVRVIHPPISLEHRAHCAEKLDRWFKETISSLPQAHFARNRHIVQASDVLIATPREEATSGLGGT